MYFFKPAWIWSARVDLNSTWLTCLVWFFLWLNKAWVYLFSWGNLALIKELDFLLSEYSVGEQFTQNFPFPPWPEWWDQSTEIMLISLALESLGPDHWNMIQTWLFYVWSPADGNQSFSYCVQVMNITSLDAIFLCFPPDVTIWEKNRPVHLTVYLLDRFHDN